MKKLLIAAASSCTLAALAVPAQATPPSVVESFTDRTVTLAAGPDTCSFPIVAHLEGGRRVTTFFDRNGTVVRRTVLLHSFTITYTNPLSGKSLVTPLAGPVIGEPQADGTWLVTIPGNDGRFVAPGEGIIFANVGLRIGFQDDPVPPVLASDFFKSVGIQDTSEFPAVCGPLS